MTARGVKGDGHAGHLHPSRNYDGVAGYAGVFEIETTLFVVDRALVPTAEGISFAEGRLGNVHKTVVVDLDLGIDFTAVRALEGDGPLGHIVPTQIDMIVRGLKRERHLVEVAGIEIRALIKASESLPFSECRLGSSRGIEDAVAGKVSAYGLAFDTVHDGGIFIAARMDGELGDLVTFFHRDIHRKQRQIAAVGVHGEERHPEPGGNTVGGFLRTHIFKVPEGKDEPDFFAVTVRFRALELAAYAARDHVLSELLTARECDRIFVNPLYFDVFVVAQYSGTEGDRHAVVIRDPPRVESHRLPRDERERRPLGAFRVGVPAAEFVTCFCRFLFGRVDAVAFVHGHRRKQKIAAPAVKLDEDRLRPAGV